MENQPQRQCAENVSMAATESCLQDPSGDETLMKLTSEYIEAADRRIRAFCQQKHSLRLSASNIAAAAGLHPYKNLAEMLHQLIYQDCPELLRRDTDLLGITVQQVVHKEEHVLQELAQRAGVSVKDCLNAKHGTVRTVQAATKLKQETIQKAAKTKKISADELQQFSRAVRHTVDTGFGQCHENAALDWLEQHTGGWPVTHRNAEIRAWGFQKSLACTSGTNNNDSVAPVGPAAPWKRRRQAVAAVVDLTREEEGSSNETITSTTNSSTTEPPPEEEDEPAPPFFWILGSVDGLREELAPNNNNNNSDDADDDSWILRQVVVECKHRMRQVHVVPPLYEQVQAVVYCLMYDCRDADLVQVLRTTKKASPSPISKKAKTTTKTASDQNQQHQQTTLESCWGKQSNGDEDNKEEGNNDAKDATDDANEEQGVVGTNETDAACATEQDG